MEPIFSRLSWQYGQPGVTKATSMCPLPRLRSSTTSSNSALSYGISDAPNIQLSGTETANTAANTATHPTVAPIHRPLPSFLPTPLRLSDMFTPSAMAVSTAFFSRDTAGGMSARRPMH